MWGVGALNHYKIVKKIELLHYVKTSASASAT